MTVPEEMAAEAANKKAEREALRGVIQQWNANRLDLFELSEPNEDLEFHGVMRFYFQDSGQKVATKCIRVASDATSQAVIETLIEKFRPDMRMLSVPEYALYEIHENGEERKLGLEEKPLLVQLNWHIDDREGRFLLRRIDDKTNAQGVGFAEGTSFRRKLSKREKKQIKKQEKLSRLKSPEQDENTAPVDQNGVAEKLYTELPETSFTRSISNPEAVMRRRRQQKLEKKLQQFRSKDGGPDTGGTLKIYGEALCKDVPYKTLLLSVRDSAAQVVREMLSKYGLDKVDPQQYCLVQMNGEVTNGNNHQEYILDDDECPLAILMNHPSNRGSIMFHVRRRPADYVPRKRKKKPTGKWSELEHRYEDERLPFLLELNPDGTDIPNGAGVRHRLQPNVTEVGSERPIGTQAVQAQTLTLSGPTVMPRHCVIAFTENIVTLTPCSRDAHTYVNNQRIHQTTILQNGAIIKFGRMHTFRFIDPAPEDRIRQRHDSHRPIEYSYDRRSPDTNSQDVNSEKFRSSSGTPNDGQDSSPSSPSKAVAASPRNTMHSAPTSEGTHNYETTFDLDGNVETASLTSSKDGNRFSQQYDRQPRGTDPILPAVLEFLEETEETFLHAVITDVEPSAPQFKLAPTYTLYLAARYRASTHYRPELQPTERAHRLTVMLANVATMIQHVIQERYMDASSLALWLANGSELLHMLKSDRHVGAFSTRAQDILADAVQTAFASLIRCVSLELAPAMSQFMADADEPAKEAGVLQIFSNTMTLLRRFRVNAALTIQLFSHLFHAINATAFNTLVSNGNLCVRWFGRRLKARLNALETWAERQGLELASQCHLATIMQATHLLQAPKYNTEELATLSSTCFKLNSLQVRALLQKYQPAADEPRLTAELIENVVRVIENVADTLARADGREIRLEEEPTLALALLLPEDGYSCEVIRGVPPGLEEFLAPLQRDGLCRMAPQPTSSGYWTIYMIDHHNNFRSPSAMSNRSGGYSGHMVQSHSQPEIQIIKLHKSTNGMGLSIVAAKGAGQDRLGIYIKSVVAGGAADADGRLTAGDQLLKVDGQSLVGITQEKAAEYLVRTGPIVTLEVAKQGAIYHGLATLLSQPSPVMMRAHKARPKSEQLEQSRIGDPAQPSTSYSMDNLISGSKQTGYQERLVDWDYNERVQPGATISHQVTPSKPTYFHYYESPRHMYYSGGVGSHPLGIGLSQPLVMNRQSNSCLPMYPIDESPVDEEFLRPKTNYWAKRPIPIIQEPNQIFLTIPNTTQRCPPYPHPPPPVITISLENDDDMQYGYQPQDDLNTINDQKDTHNHPQSFSFYNESIPYIDQVDDSTKELEDREKIFSNNKSDINEHQGGQSKFVENENCTYFDKNKEKEKNILEACSSELELNSMQKKNFIRNYYCDHISRPKENNLSDVSKEPEKVNSLNYSLIQGENCTENELDITSDTSSENINIQIENEVDHSTISTPKMHTIMPELNLDLSGLNSDVSSEESNPEKCWKSPEEIRLGCGRVAALAKHFSKLGEAGLIKFKSIKLSSSRQFVSEPDMASPREWNLRDTKKSSIKEFKSETDLTKVDKSIATTPEKEWSMILLDIQTKTDLEMQNFICSASAESDEHIIKVNLENKKTQDDTSLNKVEKKNSKLSASEQQKIIQQLEEFCNLDNADAPLFIPEQKNSKHENKIKISSNCSDKTLILNKSTHYSTVNPVEIPQLHNVVSSRMHMRKFRQHSLSSLSSPLSLSPDYEENSRMNKLEKYWSMKDLMPIDEKNKTKDIPNYFIFTSSRITSAPEMSNISYDKSLNKNKYSIDNVIVKNTITINNVDVGKESILCNENKEIKKGDSIKQERATSPIETKSPKKKNIKFPNSFIRTRSISNSDDKLNKKKLTNYQELKKTVCKSLEQISTVENDIDYFKSNTDVSQNISQSTSSQQDKVLKEINRNKYLENHYSTNPIKSYSKISKPLKKKSLIMKKISKSDLDVSEKKPTPRFEREDWIFCNFPPLEVDSESRPRRMSERDLPSRLGHEPASQQIHSSKSVPALHNVGTEGKLQTQQQQQHEVFNPGYSRASSSNSVTPPVQPPPMPAINGATSLRSRSSHNLHDPVRMGTLPPSGLVNRQQSSPNLNPSQIHGNITSNLQSNEAERFYQNLSVYRHQDSMIKQQPSPPQTMDDRNLLHAQKNLRGSQSSLNRPITDMNQARDRPISAYIPQGQQSTYTANQIQQGPPSRSQSSRDIIRQEAKLQEMQEEVRRRELRGGIPSTNQYRPLNTYNARPITAAQTASTIRPRPTGSTPNLGPNSPNYNSRVPPNYGYPEPQYNQYGQYNKQQQITNQYAVVPKKNDPARTGQIADVGREYAADRSVIEYNRQYGTHNGSQFANSPADVKNGQGINESTINRIQNNNEDNNEILPTRPILPEEGYRESPPPPPLNTATHPLYNKQVDSRYTASMQDPPRGSYYPASGVTQQTRQYQYNATNPWQREEREKEQARRRETTKLWRDQQIAELSSLSHRTPQQEEQLRALQLERDFQKRAEEAAAQQDDDDDDCNDVENESVQRVQGLLRMAANQDKNVQANQQNTLVRSSTNNQSMRGSVLSQSSIPMTSQSSGQRSGNYIGQNDNSMHSQQVSSPVSGQSPISPSYNPPVFGQLNTKNAQPQISEDQRRIDEYKRRTEFDENRKREEDIRQQQIHQQQMKQLYQQHQSNIKNQQHLHPGMLRLDNLVINGPGSPSSQNENNDAPPPPERGSSYTVMSQQSVLRSNNSTSSANIPIGSSSIKRVSFHDPNANIEQIPRNSTVTPNTTSSVTMDTIREDPNNFINDAETLLASPKTPDGPGNQFGGTTPGVIGAQEVYKDPRQKRLAEKQKQQQNSQLGEVPEKLSFKEKMKMFAMETGEDGTPRDKVKISRAQREIDNIGSPLSSLNNNNRS